ncbi:MAG: M20/M25/M40 family metallo-hydrolase [Lentisphaerae bacterium]|nr:M20/M25/M40 family metallo-hydrolase [Lentisphaerota bacterium]
MNKTDFERIFADQKNRYLDEWMKLLSFPSIGTDPDCEQACNDCANWLVEHLRNIGFESRLLLTESKPVVFGEHIGQPDKPIILFYGHYDVQPVDPLEEWNNPPFEPVLKNGRVYARGAQDDKGQFLSALKAMETLIANDCLDVTVKVLLEGEEECGSDGITKSLSKWRELIQANLLMVADTSTVPSSAPTIIMGLRGLIYLTATLYGPSHDLHSGLHGGCALNPAAEIARLVASLHNNDGSIAVAGFYDNVKAPTPREEELLLTGEFDAASYEKEIGVPPVGGERNYSPLMRVGFRPSIDVTGIHSGFGGTGVKTVIPAKAFAKITSRLVPDQKPADCLQAIINHLQAHTPHGMRLEISDTGGVFPGFRLNPDSETAKKAIAVLSQMSDQKPAFLWEGASIPVVVELARVSGADDLLLVGFGHENDMIHAPNESFSLDQFQRSYIYTCLMLSSL